MFFCLAIHNINGGGIENVPHQDYVDVWRWMYPNMAFSSSAATILNKAFKEALIDIYGEDFAADFTATSIRSGALSLIVSNTKYCTAIHAIMRSGHDATVFSKLFVYVWSKFLLQAIPGRVLCGFSKPDRQVKCAKFDGVDLGVSKEKLDNFVFMLMGRTDSSFLPATPNAKEPKKAGRLWPVSLCCAATVCMHLAEYEKDAGRDHRIIKRIALVAQQCGLTYATLKKWGHAISINFRAANFGANDGDTVDNNEVVSLLKDVIESHRESKELLLKEISSLRAQLGSLSDDLVDVAASQVHVESPPKSTSTSNKRRRVDSESEPSLEAVPVSTSSSPPVASLFNGMVSGLPKYEFGSLGGKALHSMLMDWFYFGLMDENNFLIPIPSKTNNYRANTLNQIRKIRNIVTYSLDLASPEALEKLKAPKPKSGGIVEWETNRKAAAIEIQNDVMKQLAGHEIICGITKPLVAGKASRAKIAKKPTVSALEGRLSKIISAKKKKDKENLN